MGVSHQECGPFHAKPASVWFLGTAAIVQEPTLGILNTKKAALKWGTNPAKHGMPLTSVDGHNKEPSCLFANQLFFSKRIPGDSESGTNKYSSPFGILLRTN